AYHHLLRFLIKCGLEAGVSSGSGHDVGNGVAVAGLHGGVGLLAAAHALHPVAHVVGGEHIATSVCRGGHGRRLGQAELGQQVGGQVHSVGRLLGKAAGGRYAVGN
nr:hypothetical protein [Tanacetum cinerariifolium]